MKPPTEFRRFSLDEFFPDRLRDSGSKISTVQNKTDTKTSQTTVAALIYVIARLSRAHAPQEDAKSFAKSLRSHRLTTTTRTVRE